MGGALPFIPINSLVVTFPLLRICVTGVATGQLLQFCLCLKAWRRSSESDFYHKWDSWDLVKEREEMAENNVFNLMDLMQWASSVCSHVPVTPENVFRGLPCQSALEQLDLSPVAPWTPTRFSGQRPLRVKDLMSDEGSFDSWNLTHPQSLLVSKVMWDSNLAENVLAFILCFLLPLSQSMILV